MKSMKETLQFLLKYLLLPFSLLYGFIIFLRNKLYDIGVLSSLEFNAIPVINVGNLSVGGTGKSPHIEYLIRLLGNKFHTATLSRGYKRHSRGFRIADDLSTSKDIGDEPMQFRRKFNHVVVAVAEERTTAVPELLQRAPFLECILLDDAFQHRSIRAGKNILLTDYSHRYTKDYILPFGRLREGRKAAERADYIIVTKCPHELSIKEAEEIRKELNAEQEVYFSTLTYDDIYFLNENIHGINKDTFVLMVTAIANPEPMKAELESRAKGVHMLSYRDHHYFNFDDLKEIRDTFANIETENKCIVTTEKDATRLILLKEKLEEYNLNIGVLPVRISFLFDQGLDFDQKINDYVMSYYPTINELEPDGTKEQEQKEEGLE